MTQKHEIKNRFTGEVLFSCDIPEGMESGMIARHALEEAVAITQNADYFAVIGTSLQVYPAAGLLDFTAPQIPVFYIDPKPIKIPNLRNPLDIIPEVASEGMKILKKKLLPFI